MFVQWVLVGARLARDPDASVRRSGTSSSIAGKPCSHR
ncbi:hypothetical protein [Pseudomonas sp. FG-3G]|nr:hypothetical protein [Pseudomonas sp. FG-3G]